MKSIVLRFPFYGEGVIWLGGISQLRDPRLLMAVLGAHPQSVGPQACDEVVLSVHLIVRRREQETLLEFRAKNQLASWGWWVGSSLTSPPPSRASHRSVLLGSDPFSELPLPCLVRASLNLVPDQVSPLLFFILSYLPPTIHSSYSSRGDFVEPSDQGHLFLDLAKPHFVHKMDSNPPRRPFADSHTS